MPDMIRLTPDEIAARRETLLQSVDNGNFDELDRLLFAAAEANRLADENQRLSTVAAMLSAKEIDSLLERLDQSTYAIQRGAIAKFLVTYRCLEAETEQQREIIRKLLPLAKRGAFENMYESKCPECNAYDGFKNRTPLHNPDCPRADTIATAEAAVADPRHPSDVSGNYPEV